MKRCSWANSSPSEQKYHDQEWGVPIHSDQLLFEFLILEGAQAGLSWSTILNKREGYRNAFDHFDVQKVARYTTKKIDKLLLNPDIVRNKLKVNAAIMNAKAFLAIQQDFVSFDDYIWQFVNHKPIQNTWKNAAQVPTCTSESDTMSKELKKRGFKFVGSTICYAFMQAVGMVNDHSIDCFRHQEVKKIS
jgi:DNA-3-methyladenine glycosylase I